MRVTSSLWRQHIGRMVKRHWEVQGNRKVLETGTEEALLAKNIKIIDPQELFVKPKQRTQMKIELLVPKPLPLDNTHPDWKDEPCFSYRDHNVLVEGVPQAQVLTKTIKISNELPETVNRLVMDHDERIMQSVRRAVETSTIYDAHQELLPKLKDPARPAWVFPRAYGITNIRKIRNLSQKLIQLCESVSGPRLTRERNIIHNGLVSLPISKDNYLLQFVLRSDMLIASTNPLKSVEVIEESSNAELPDIYPLLSTISMNKENIYTLRDLYPVDAKSRWVNVHTIYAHHNPEEVKNLFEEPVTETQILSRSLIKSFGVAAACAKQRFGESIADLPEPIVVQCVQSNGQDFHFSVFQLNTLNLNGTEGTKNFWWSLPRIKLYEVAGYENGQPIIEDYNPEVFKRIFAFHANE